MILSKEDIKKLTREDVIEYCLRSESIHMEIQDIEHVVEVLPELKRLGIVCKYDVGLYFYMDVKFSINRSTDGNIDVKSFTYRKDTVYPRQSYPPMKNGPVTIRVTGT